MKAILTTKESNGKNYADTKETINTMNLVAHDAKGNMTTPVIVRLYMGRSNKASTVYCSVWVSGNGYHTAGHGSAGGWGYHKGSAAMQEALSSAGISLIGSPYCGETQREGEPCSISGCGSSSMESAMVAIAQALGFACTERNKDYLIV